MLFYNDSRCHTRLSDSSNSLLGDQQLSIQVALTLGNVAANPATNAKGVMYTNLTNSMSKLPLRKPQL